MSPKRLIAVCLSAIICGISAGLVYGYLHSHRSVHITMSTATDAVIYKATSDQGEHSDDKVATLSGTTTKVLRKGKYVLAPGISAKDYQSYQQVFTVADDDIEVMFNPSYSASKLASLLPNEQPAITQALTAKFPAISTSYDITAGQLLKQGDWYGAVLRPRNPNNDTLRVVLTKKKGTWQVVTNPPPILLSKPVYPQIPEDVITSINNI